MARTKRKRREETPLLREETHVIFLGAGASFNSGYPIGEKLRLRLCSREHFERDLRAVVFGSLGEQERVLRAAECTNLMNVYLKHFDGFHSSTELFRHGCFGTVDEFSRLAAAKYPEQVQDMKRLMRLAFSFNNPEEQFQESDYYPFVQRLFEEDLCSLRSDITVLSYNYDCYLDFLLLKANRLRRQLSGASEVANYEKNTLTSGFFDTSYIKDEHANHGFNYLKLHGGIAYPEGKDFSFATLFDPDIRKRIPMTFAGYKATSVPPIVFPWELFDESDNFISENDFVYVKQSKTAEERKEAKALFKVYESIWKTARQVVLRATKVSFVGLSMHPFMETGLAYLFRRKTGAPQVVVANTVEVESLCKRLGVLLRTVAPDMEARGSLIDERARMAVESGRLRYPIYGMTPRSSFRDFIEKEMNF
jgi:hypothetical protein